MPKAAARTGIALLLLLSALASSQVLPRPQISSAVGKPVPNFTLKDEHGNPFKLASLRGTRVLLIFYRGYWWPSCVGQLREFARHKKEFDPLHTRLVAISVDNRPYALSVWEKVVNREFTILSDPGARVIRSYGLVHPGGGMQGEDIALDTTLLVGADGRELWRRVSETLLALPTAEETLAHVQATVCSNITSR